MKNIIEIEVKGDTGTGKTEVMQVIKDALVAYYGPHTQVASYDLSQESEPLETAKFTGQRCRQADTVFVLSETNDGAFHRKPKRISRNAE